MADETDSDVEIVETDIENEEEIPEPEGETESEDEFAIEIEGEESQDEPELVKKLRTEIRDRDRELAEHRKAAAPRIELGDKPTLESSEWDEERYEADLTAWHDRKRQIENQDAEQAQAAEVRNQDQARKFANYRAAAVALPVKDFEDAEKAVIAALPDSPDRPIQQALLNYCKDPAKVVYALAKHPAKLQALAAEPDIIKVILMIADLERNLKVTTRKAPPPPEAETIQRGSAPMSVKADKALEALEREAERNGGDRSKIVAYKRQQKQAA